MVAAYPDSHLAEDFHSQTESTTDEQEEDEFGSVVILGKGTPESVKFEWRTTDWSKCTQTCGGNGFQVRSTFCIVRLTNTTQDIESNFCEDAKVELPATIRKCGLQECPKWIATEWTPCEKSKCFTWNTGKYG